MLEMQVSAIELCDYVTWAYFNSIPLQGDATQQDEYKRLATETCPSEYYNKMTTSTREISEKNGNLVSSGFISNLSDKVKMVKDSKQKNADDLPLALTNYQALNSDVLNTIAAQALSSDVIFEALPASSSLIFEIWADDTVHAYLNDEEATPVGCKADAPCTTDLFLAGLDSKELTDDVESACNAQPEKEDLDIEQ